jgi:hypothetical protein
MSRVGETTVCNFDNGDRDFAVHRQRQVHFERAELVSTLTFLLIWTHACRFALSACGKCGAVVALFAIIAGPSMKIDPEEMKQLQQEMKDSPLSFLASGSASSSKDAPQPALATSSAKRTTSATLSATTSTRKRR